MKAVVYFEIPVLADAADLEALVEKARERGYPMLAVEFDVDPDSFDDAPAEGMSMEALAGLRLGEAIGELEGEIDTVSPVRVPKLLARIVDRSIANPEVVA